MLEATANSDATRCPPCGPWESQLRECRQFPAMLELKLEGAPLAWLRWQPDPVKLAWADRGSHEVLAGLGMAASVVGRPGELPQSVVDRCRSRLAGHPQLKFYGGFAFRGERAMSAAEWQPFGAALFWMPRLTFDGYRLRLVVLDAADVNNARWALAALRPAEPMPPWECPTCLERVDLPERSRWLANVQKVLELFRDEILEKVVLARRATFHFDAPHVLGH